MTAPRKRGRPPIPPETRRDRRLEVRVSEIEETRIESNATRAKLPVSAFVRRRALR